MTCAAAMIADGDGIRKMCLRSEMLDRDISPLLVGLTLCQISIRSVTMLGPGLAPRSRHPIRISQP